MLIVLVVVITVAALAGAEYIRRRLKPEVLPHVEATPRPDGFPVITLRETPERGEATHALRLKAHTGPGTLIVKEVDDDQTAE